MTEPIHLWPSVVSPTLASLQLGKFEVRKRHILYVAIFGAGHAVVAPVIICDDIPSYYSKHYVIYTTLSALLSKLLVELCLHGYYLALPA